MKQSLHFLLILPFGRMICSTDLTTSGIIAPAHPENYFVAQEVSDECLDFLVDKGSLGSFKKDEPTTSRLITETLTFK